MYHSDTANTLGESRISTTMSRASDLKIVLSPGRFFAANELKAMMAHVVMNYDVKFEQEGVRPPNKWYGLSLGPDPTAKVLFRKRQN